MFVRLWAIIFISFLKVFHKKAFLGTCGHALCRQFTTISQKKQVTFKERSIPKKIKHDDLVGKEQFAKDVLIGSALGKGHHLAVIPV